VPTHAQKKILHFSAEDMFDIVADVELYPDFLPWCRGARIKSRKDNVIIADLVIGFKGITERFTSKAVLDYDNSHIHVTYEDGPFKYLNNHWKIKYISDQECEVDFYVDFEFRSRILQAMIGLVFEEAVKRMVAAFESRAEKICPIVR
jgi:coenzyme Q-binding protein COQ10